MRDFVNRYSSVLAILFPIGLVSVLWLAWPRTPPPAEANLDTLHHAILAESGPLSQNTTFAIASLNEANRQALAKTLMIDLKSAEPTVRHQASRALLTLGPETVEAIPILTQVFVADPDEQVRKAAGAAIARAGAKASIAVPALIEALQFPKNATTAEITEVLGALGPSASAALSDLQKAGRDSSAPVRAKALEAISAVGTSKDSLAPTLRGFRDGNRQVQRAALESAYQLGAAAVAAVPELIPFLHDHDIDFRMKAILALGKMGESAAPAAHELASLLTPPAKSDPPHTDLRWAVTQTLASTGRPGAIAVPALLAALRDPEPLVRAGAVNALQSIGARPKEVTAALIRHENDDDPSVRLQILDALMKLSPQSTETRNVLRRHLQDPSVQVAQRASFLLQVAERPHK